MCQVSHDSTANCKAAVAILLMSPHQLIMSLAHVLRNDCCRLNVFDLRFERDHFADIAEDTSPATVCGGGIGPIPYLST